MPTPMTALRISKTEKAELEALAKQAGVSLSLAFRRGARIYLSALLEAPEPKPGRPRKGARLAA